MEISPRKAAKRAQEPVDEWLQSEGYFRKLAPRDPTCLFRAVSEQVYLTQHYHIRVRRECVEFMRKMRHIFEEYVTIPFENYLEQMACFTEWGGINEIQAMSLLYKKDFLIFNGQKQICSRVTNNGFKDMIYLCHTPQKQYETVCTRNFMATAAHCQSIVYQILYKNVFQMSNIEYTVNKMLHDKNTLFRHNKFFLKGNLEIRDQLTLEIYNKVENNNEEAHDTQEDLKGMPPFPYRIAKALDPNIYRNTDFDIWHELRREVKSAGWTRYNTHELQVGGKCLVQIHFNEEESDLTNYNIPNSFSSEKDVNGNDSKVIQKRTKSPVFYCGHIQEMGKNQGPVLVFIEELGEKRSVPYSALKPLPLKKNRLNIMPLQNKNVLSSTSPKWKRNCNTNSRKIKDTISSMTVISNSLDKNGNRNRSVNNINKNNYKLSQWHEEKIEHQEMYEHYEVDECSKFGIDNANEVFSEGAVVKIREDTSSENNNQEVQIDSKSENSFINMADENKNAQGLSETKSSEALESDAELIIESKKGSEKEADYPSYPGVAKNTTPTISSSLANPDNSGNQLDRMLRAVNCTVQKSVDENGRDLPLADTFTLRFFYNLGLECFQYFKPGDYSPNNQPMSFGQWYQGGTQNAVINDVTNALMQYCNTSEKEENSNDWKADKKQGTQETSHELVNVSKSVQPSKNEPQKNETLKETLSMREKPRDHANSNRDSIRINRNSLAPRFKKNAENRNRNPGPQRNSSQYQNNTTHQGPGSARFRYQEQKGDSVNSAQHTGPSHLTQLPYSPNSYPPYTQQGMFTSVPFYGNENESFGGSFFPPNPGFFPVPCVPHPEISENNNISPIPLHMYPGVDYTQNYPGVCPPYMCVPPSPYNMQPQNMPDQWYTVPGQPHFMQYPSMLPIHSDSPCNVSNQAPNSNVSP